METVKKFRFRIEKLEERIAPSKLSCACGGSSKKGGSKGKSHKGGSKNKSHKGGSKGHSHKGGSNHDCNPCPVVKCDPCC